MTTTTTGSRTTLPHHLLWDAGDVPYPTEQFDPNLPTHVGQHNIHHHPDANAVTCNLRNRPNTTRPTTANLTKPTRLCKRCLCTVNDNGPNNTTWVALHTAHHIHNLQTKQAGRPASTYDDLDVHDTLTNLAQITAELTSTRVEVTLLPTHQMDNALATWCLDTLEQVAEQVAERGPTLHINDRQWAHTLTAGLCDYGTPASRGHNTTGRHWTNLTKHTEQHHNRNLYGDARKLANDVTTSWLRHIKAGHTTTDADQHALQALQQINNTTYELRATQTKRVQESCQTLHQQLTDTLDTQTQLLLQDTTDRDLGPAANNALQAATVVRINSWWHNFSGRARTPKQQLIDVTGRAIIGRNAHQSTGTNHTLWLRCNRLEALWLAHHYRPRVIAVVGDIELPDPQLARTADLLQIDDPNDQLTAAHQLT